MRNSVKCLVFILAMVFVLSGCSSGDKSSSENKPSREGLTVVFKDTDLDVFGGFKKVVKQAVDNGIYVMDIMTMRFYDANGDWLDNSEANRRREDENFNSKDVLWVVSYTSEQVYGAGMEAGDYEVAYYDFQALTTNREAGLDHLYINGSKASLLSEAKLAKSAMDISGLHAGSVRGAYTELYINGVKTEPDASYYEEKLDEQKVREAFSKRTDIPYRIREFLPSIVNTMIRVDYSEELAALFDEKKLKNTVFLIQKITEALEAKENSICVVQYLFRNGGTDVEIVIRVAKR